MLHILFVCFFLKAVHVLIFGNMMKHQDKIIFDFDKCLYNYMPCFDIKIRYCVLMQTVF